MPAPDICTYIRYCGGSPRTRRSLVYYRVLPGFRSGSSFLPAALDPVNLKRSAESVTHARRAMTTVAGRCPLTNVAAVLHPVARVSCRSERTCHVHAMVGMTTIGREGGKGQEPVRKV